LKNGSNLQIQMEARKFYVAMAGRCALAFAGKLLGIYLKFQKASFIRQFDGKHVGGKFSE